jgi:acetyl-CoA carboxylase biotin carboxyl carrier protein
MPARKTATSGSNLSRNDIERLIEVINEKGIEEFELEQGGTRLRIVSGRAVAPPMVAGPPAAPVPAEAPPAEETSRVPGTSATPDAQPEDDPNLKKVTSPMVGTFYRSSSPGAPPFVEVGDKVDDQTVLCIIEAMKLMNEIHAETRGVVKKILVENGQPVEYGQVLFLVEPG